MLNLFIKNLMDGNLKQQGIKKFEDLPDKAKTYVKA